MRKVDSDVVKSYPTGLLPYSIQEISMLNTYQCFYRGRQTQLQAETSYLAQQHAAKYFKAKKAYDVTVILVAHGDEPVVHSTAGL